MVYFRAAMITALTLRKQHTLQVSYWIQISQVPFFGAFRNILSKLDPFSPIVRVKMDKSYHLLTNHIGILNLGIALTNKKHNYWNASGKNFWLICFTPNCSKTIGKRWTTLTFQGTYLTHYSLVLLFYTT